MRPAYDLLGKYAEMFDRAVLISESGKIGAAPNPISDHSPRSLLAPPRQPYTGEIGGRVCTMRIGRRVGIPLESSVDTCPIGLA